MVVDALFSEPLFEEPETRFLDDIPLTLLAGFPFNTVLYQNQANVENLYQRSTKKTAIKTSSQKYNYR